MLILLLRDVYLSEFTTNRRNRRYCVWAGPTKRNMQFETREILRTRWKLESQRVKIERNEPRITDKNIKGPFENIARRDNIKLINALSEKKKKRQRVPLTFRTFIDFTSRLRRVQIHCGLIVK